MLHELGVTGFQFAALTEACSPAFRLGGNLPSRFCTKKSCVRRCVIGLPAPWLAPGISKKSKSLPALMRASTSRRVDSGGTLSSISPTMRKSLPPSLAALSMLEDFEYQLSSLLLQILSGGMYPIHCSFHEAL